MSEMRQRIESLSPRQLQILVYVAQHLSSKEIAQLLGLSAATVDSHIAAALQRLGVASRREAAVQMIEFGYAPPFPDPRLMPPGTDRHHGDNLPSNLHVLPVVGTPNISEWPGRGPTRPSGEDGGATAPLSSRSGMGRVIGRYLLDAFFISLFFAVMSAVAFGVHEVVVVCERWKIDPYVLLILKGVSYTLAILDAVGVITATGLLTYRFIRALVRADD